jgi:CubicO group peptidase (beta-lactamase class C family)
MSTRFLADFIARVEALKLDVDAVMVYQGGELVDAHRWSPDVPTDIYSHTKGFTSSAIGIAISEGLLSLEDRLVDHFPDHLPAHPAPLLGEIRLRHLLTMSSGFNAALLMLDQRRGPGAPDDYVRYMLAQPVPVQPGAAFHYSSADSYLAGCMLENRAGMTLRDYVYARILQPLDIPYPEWEHCPHGHTFGGGGMSLRTADMAKLGQLYLDGGAWQGRQIVPREWVAEATRKQIDTAPSEDRWQCGYGYQFWLDPFPGAYRADGLWGQYTHVLPHRRAVVSLNCHARDTGPILEAFAQESVERL